MTTYILLRNNKETAPCTIDELKRLGIKADDLVWVEGQSVCWMNPGQVSELKSLVGQPVQELPDSKSIGKMEPLQTYEQKWAGSSHLNTESEIPETKYSKPLDEIKEIYLKNLEKKNRGFQLSPQLRKAGLYAGLILVGIITGILIKKTGAQKDPVLSKTEIKPIPNQIAPASTTTMDPGSVEHPDQTITASESEQEHVGPVENISREIKKAISKKTEGPAKQSTTLDETIPEPSTESPAETVESKEEIKAVKKISLNEIRSQVSVKTNDYSVGSFGGIKNLKLTITNHSKYELDKVAVEVQYLKPLNELLRSETVSVQSLGPGETKVIEVKKSSRGVKVSCKVTNIRSKDFTDDTAGL